MGVSGHPPQEEKMVSGVITEVAETRPGDMPGDMDNIDDIDEPGDESMDQGEPGAEV